MRQWASRCVSGHFQDLFHSTLSRTRRAVLTPKLTTVVLNEQKIQHRLISSVAVEGGVRQSYYHRGVDGDADTLLELFWMNGVGYQRDPVVT